MVYIPMFSTDHLNSSICEVLIGNEWKVYDGHAKDTEKDREFYSKAFVLFAQGSYQIRINGTVQSSMTSSDSLFYRYKQR